MGGFGAEAGIAIVIGLAAAMAILFAVERW